MYCRNCKTEKPEHEFYKLKSGRYCDCKKCSNARNKLWVENNRESRKAIKRRWYAKNHEEIRKKTNSKVAKDKLVNAEKYKKRKLEWVRKNPEKVKIHIEKSNRRQSMELSNSFVLRCLRLKYAPQEIIDLKRASLQIKRLLKEIGYDHNYRHSQ